jgi:hypothetical protein
MAVMPLEAAVETSIYEHLAMARDDARNQTGEQKRNRGVCKARRKQSFVGEWAISACEGHNMVKSQPDICVYTTLHGLQLEYAEGLCRKRENNGLFCFRSNKRWQSAVTYLESHESIPLLKKSGGKYAETHHMIELNKQSPQSLQSWNVIVVCPTCHKTLHFGDVKAELLDPGWRVVVNGQTHQWSKP